MAQIILKPAGGTPSIVVAGTILTDRSVRAFSMRAPSYFPTSDRLIAGIEDTIYISSKARSLGALHGAIAPPLPFANERSLAGAPGTGFHPVLDIYARADACRFLENPATAGIDTLTISCRALELIKRQAAFGSERDLEEGTNFRSDDRLQK